MYSVTKIFEFEAAHKLNLDYESPCQKIHGHSYKCEMTVGTKALDFNGMVFDFTHLSEVKKEIIDEWDHKLIVSNQDKMISGDKVFNPDLLNVCSIAVFDGGNVTAELMAAYVANSIKGMLQDKLPDLINLIRYIEVSIWETSSNKATYYTEDIII